MNSRGKYLIKNMGILTISVFASKIMVFLLVPLYTSVLSTSEYGTYDLIVSTVQLVFPLLTLNIVDAVMRFLMEQQNRVEDVVNIGFCYLILSFAAVGFLILVCYFTKVLPDIQDYLLLIFLYYVFYGSYQFLTQFAKGLEKVLYMGVAGVMSTVILLGTNILFLLVFRWGMDGFFLANILAQTIPSIYLFERLKIWTYFRKIKIDKNLKREMLLYCMPLIFSVIGWWINNASDKYVVTFICGAAANGILSVAYKIPSILNVFQNIFVQAWQISAIKEYGREKTDSFYGDAFSILNFMIVCCCSMLIILSKPIAVILFAKEFYSAWQFVPFLLVANTLNAASGFMGPILSAAKDSKNMARSAIYGAGANLIMNIVFVYAFGIQGAAIATAISSFIIYQIRKNAVGNQIRIEKYWRILISWILLCVQAILEIYMNNYILQGIILFFIVAMNIDMIIKMYKSLSRILKKRKKKLEK